MLLFEVEVVVVCEFCVVDFVDDLFVLYVLVGEDVGCLIVGVE